MALEDRIRSSVDQTLQGLVSSLLTAADEHAAQQVADTESRLREEFNSRVEALAHEARQRAAEDARAAAEAEVARAVAEAERTFDERLQAAVQEVSARTLAEAEQRFQDDLQRAVAEAEARAIAATEASIADARAGEREMEMAGMARLVESIRGLDGASSLSEVLDALALAAARETARAAVLVLKGEHVVGWRLSGFGARDTHPKSIDLPLAESGVIGMAATSSRPVTTRDGAGDGPGFEHLPEDRMGLAMPVIVGGRVVAVVYADGVTDTARDHVVPSPWPEAVEVLARHAGRCLEALTAQKAAVVPAVARRAGGAHDTGAGASAAPGTLG